MSYQPGEIYFIRELDYVTETVTPFVKIGLVRYKDKRNSFNRLAEHQTGNPRKLKLDAAGVVTTQAVDMVEAQLHRIFASQRISGEWFEFTDENDLVDAIKQAQALSVEVTERVKIFDAAEKLKITPSDKGSRHATDEEKALAKIHAVSKKQISICASLQDEIQELLVAAVSAGTDVSRTATKTVKTYSPKFLETEFQEAHPDLWEKYLANEESWKQQFLNKYKIADDSELGETFLASINEIQETIKTVAGNHDLVSNLNEPVLTLTQLVGLAEWEMQLSEAQLKVAIQDFEEITGVCTWKRYMSVTKKFQSQLFAEENPELAMEFVSKPVTKEYVKAKKSKS